MKSLTIVSEFQLTLTDKVSLIASEQNYHDDVSRTHAVYRYLSAKSGTDF